MEQFTNEQLSDFFDGSSKAAELISETLALNKVNLKSGVYAMLGLIASIAMDSERSKEEYIKVMDIHRDHFAKMWDENEKNED